MSSATSTDPGLRPWQLFLLAGMLAATAVVLVSTGRSMSGIIVLSITIVAASFVAVATYQVVGPLLVGAPPVEETGVEGQARQALEREKALVLRSIKEIEFDHAMRKTARRRLRGDARSAAGARRGPDAAARRRRLPRGDRARPGARGRRCARPVAPTEAAPAAGRLRALPDGQRQPTRASASSAERRSREPADMTRAVVPVLAAIVARHGWSSPAAAQVAMPDAAQMSGVPLPAPELPDATVTVRAGPRADGQQRARPRGDPDHARRPGHRPSPTPQGRAQFTAVPAGSRVTAEATIDGETLRSQEFTVPASGGVRVALVAGVAKAAAAEAAARAEAAAKHRRARAPWCSVRTRG